MKQKLFTRSSQKNSWQIIYSKVFLKDLSKVVPIKRRKLIEKFAFKDLPQFSSIENAGNIEKMTGYKNHYKVRFGEYRIGILKNGNTVEIKRVLNRKEIYKFFP